MAEQYYLYHLDSRGVAYVTLNRPEIHNAFNDQFIEQLIELFTKMEADQAIRLVVLTGAGRSFCAGADLNWMKSMVNYSEDENRRDSERLATLFQTINNFTRPVIGKINGNCFGGGVGLLAVCDTCIAHDEVKLGFTEVKLGLIPAVISPFVVKKIGVSYARSSFLSGELFSAQRAYEWGLIHKVVKSDMLENAVDKSIERHLLAGPQATIAAKRLVEQVSSMLGEDESKLTSYTCSEIAKARISTEGQQGMQAILEKKSPPWIKSGEDV